MNVFIVYRAYTYTYNNKTDISINKTALSLQYLNIRVEDKSTFPEKKIILYRTTLTTTTQI